MAAPMMQALIGAPRDGFTPAEVADALSARRGALIRNGVDVLDTQDRLTGETVPMVGGSVTWAYRPESGGTAEVRRTSVIELVGDPRVPIVARRFRPWTEWAVAGDRWARFNLGVFVPTLPPATDDGVTVRRILRLADKTHRWRTSFTLTDPIVVAAGVNPVEWVRSDLLSTFGEIARITRTSVTIEEARTFDAGTPRLAVYNALLELAAYDQLIADEGGAATAVPLDVLAGRGPEVTYGPGSAPILPAGAVEPLEPTLPNVVRFVARQAAGLPSEGVGITTRVNQTTGPASVDARGEQVHVEVAVEAETQAQLEAIADAEAGRYFAGGGLRFTGSIGLNPRHGDRDVIALNRPRLGLEGAWNVTSWTYPLGKIDTEAAVTMPITAERRVA